ncbi:hypothetical protein BDW62DRAFT_200777 [Aspergillus aurantiobrunneus]
MYDLDRLPRHYDSEEEDISEPEGHSHRRSATLDSLESVGESVQPVERRTVPRLLSPFPSTGKASRPVSMDTVKRSSVATFVTEPCTIFDQNDETIIELPSPDSTTPLESPATYVPSEPLTSPRHSFRSSSSGSISDDDSDIFVAEQVTYVEAKPNLILISHTVASPLSDGSVYSTDEPADPQPVLGETSMNRGRSRYPARPARSKIQGSLSALDTLQHQQAKLSEPMSAPAVTATRSTSFRARSMSFSRPQTPAMTTETRRRLQKEPPRRPPSAQSTSTFSLFPARSNPPDEFLTRSISCSPSVASSECSFSSQSPSCTASSSPYCSPAYNRSRSGSLYSVSSLSGVPTKRPPLPLRASMAKAPGTPAGYSSSSLRAEIDTEGVPVEQGQVSQMVKSRMGRKKSVKQFKAKTDGAESSAKSFVGFMLRGKRKSKDNV